MGFTAPPGLVKGPAASSANTVQPVGAAVIPLTLKGHASQSASLQEWQSSAGTVLGSISAGGSHTVNTQATTTRPLTVRGGSDNGQILLGHHDGVTDYMLFYANVMALQAGAGGSYIFGNGTFRFLPNTDGVTLRLYGHTNVAGGLQDLYMQTSAGAGAEKRAAVTTWEWADNTDATRKGRFKLYAEDAAAPREVLRGETSGSAPLIGFLGATAVARDTGWTLSNVTTDRVLDCNSTTLDEVADVLATLIQRLIDLGFLGT